MATNFRIRRGDDTRFTGTVVDVDGTAVDITGWTFLYSAATTKGSTPVWQITGEITSAAAGEFQVDIDHTLHTATLATLFYEVEATAPNTKVYTLASGKLRIVQDVTP